MPDIRICEHCGLEFITNPSRKKRFCSIACSSKRIISKEHREKNSISNTGRVFSDETRKKIREAHIGKKASIETREKFSKIMSVRMIGNKIKLGKPMLLSIKDKISKAKKGKKFTKEHLSNLRKSFPRGDSHPNWKGGITPENVKLRKGVENRDWIKSVFSRDSYTCRRCKKGGVLQAHHIKNFADYPNDRVVIENGITLCKNCHKDFHRLYGCKKNNLEQITNFLTD